MRYNTVLFDLDGTLTDSRPGILSCIREALGDFGIEAYDDERMGSFVGPPLHHSLKNTFGMDDERCAQIVERYRALYRQRGAFENKPFPGVMEMLEKLCAGGADVGVATSKPEPIACHVVDHFGISKFIHYLSAAKLSDTEDTKETLVRTALEKLPGRPAVMIGDRVYDIGGARANGIDAVYVMYGYGSAAECEACKPDYAISSVEALSMFLLGGN